ncbi:universal stress protein [Streptomyces sp. CdTB01]|uniref:universal stress protein n=1 Tax=Streptomyces sp. CdTB01 TaxID=1725411 RepID=UPI000B32B3AC|nr:universal stress protein [Streptomyces sp. CdTB01]
MPRPVTAGIDGSVASLAAASWAAWEAELHCTELHLVAAWPPANGSRVSASQSAARRRWALRCLDLAVGRLRTRHPWLTVRTQLLDAPPTQALLSAGEHAELLVLGSRGLGTTSSSPLGSTSAGIAARAGFPVTLVRSPSRQGARRVRGAPVVLALDAGHSHDDLSTAIAFEEAALRHIPLRALYVWIPPPPSGPVRSRPGRTAPRPALATPNVCSRRPWCPGDGNSRTYGWRRPAWRTSPPAP